MIFLEMPLIIKRPLATYKKRVGLLVSRWFPFDLKRPVEAWVTIGLLHLCCSQMGDEWRPTNKYATA